MFNDFLARTSAHGVPHINESFTYTGKVFWAVVFTICAIAFSYQTYWTVDMYLR